MDNYSPDHIHYENANSIPDYLNDLNACFEMEKAIPLMQEGLYFITLTCVVSGLPKDDIDIQNELLLQEVACATAAQRCEAFLRTLDLWEESNEK